MKSQFLFVEELARSGVKWIESIEPTMRKRVTIFRTSSIHPGDEAQTVMTAVNKQILQPVVTVTPSEHWNRRVTVINIYI